MTTLYETKPQVCPVDHNVSVHKDFLKKIQFYLKQYTIFNITFISLAVFEVICCLIFFNLLTRSSLLAITLAVFLMTLFSYFILKIYFQSKKPQFFISSCKELLNQLANQNQHAVTSFEHHLFTASSLTRIANALKDFEYTFYSPIKSLDSLRLTFEKLGCWLHWHDIHLLKEWLYQQVVETYIKLIKEQPDHLQLHVALANTYVMFSTIYATPQKQDPYEEEKWVAPEKFTQEMRAKFTDCAERAIEEFKILNDYNPDDPWVYTQLAYSYHDLQMPHEEIKAYEKIATLIPHDVDTIYKLGILYFQQGQTAKGLKIYERLKASRPQKAASLIKYYGYYSSAQVT